MFRRTAYAGNSKMRLRPFLGIMPDRNKFLGVLLDRKMSSLQVVTSSAQERHKPQATSTVRPHRLTGEGLEPRACDAGDNNGFSHVDKGISLDRWVQLEPLGRDRTWLGAIPWSRFRRWLCCQMYCGSVMTLMDICELLVLEDVVYLQHIHPSIHRLSGYK